MNAPERVGTKIIVQCPSCESPAMARVDGEMQFYDPEDGPPCLYELAVCERCGSPILAAEEDYGQGWDKEPFVVWPIQQRPLSIKIPETLQRNHEEARRCFSAKAYTATAIMVRRTLEGVCRDQGISDSKMSLANMLEKLKEDNRIDGRLFEWSQELRALGNQGAHSTAIAVSRADASDALALAEALLDYLYILSAQFEEFKTRRAASARSRQQSTSADGN